MDAGRRVGLAIAVALYGRHARTKTLEESPVCRKVLVVR